MSHPSPFEGFEQDDDQFLPETVREWEEQNAAQEGLAEVFGDEEFMRWLEESSKGIKADLDATLHSVPPNDVPPASQPPPAPSQPVRHTRLKVEELEQR